MKNSPNISPSPIVGPVYLQLETSPHLKLELPIEHGQSVATMKLASNRGVELGKPSVSFPGCPNEGKNPIYIQAPRQVKRVLKKD